MLKFVKKAFRNSFEIFLWINLIVITILCAIGGTFIGSSMERSYYYSNWDRGGGYTALGFFIGVIVGVFIGLLTNIIGGGLIATILNIDISLEKNNSLKKLSLIKSGVSEELIDKILENKTNEKPNENRPSEDKWHCIKCGTANEAYLPVCKKCGEEYVEAE